MGAWETVGKSVCFSVLCLTIVLLVSICAEAEKEKMKYKEVTHSQEANAGHICVEGKLYSVVKRPQKDSFDITQVFNVTDQGIKPILCKEEDHND